MIKVYSLSFRRTPIIHILCKMQKETTTHCVHTFVLFVYVNYMTESMWSPVMWTQEYSFMKEVYGVKCKCRQKKD